MPGNVDAGHSGSAAAVLQHDDGLVVVVERGNEASGARGERHLRVTAESER